MDSRVIRQQENASAKDNVQLGFLLALGFAIFGVVISMFFVHGIVAIVEATAVGV